MAREGQKRIEVRPGAFIWMNEADQKAFAERNAQRSEAPIAVQAPESAAVGPAENASQPQPKPRRAKE